MKPTRVDFSGCSRKNDGHDIDEEIKHEQSRSTIRLRHQLATVLPWHSGGPEARGPASRRLFLQLHRAEIAMDLFQRDPARGHLGSGVGKGRRSRPNLPGGTYGSVYG